MWLLNFHRCRCSSWRLWYLSFRFDDGNGYMGNRTEDAKRDDKDDIYFRILLRLVAFYLKKNLFTGIRNNLGIGQCCKTPLPPKLDRQLLPSLPLEQLLFLLSWFHLHRLRCSQTKLTNLQLHTQLNKQEMVSEKGKNNLDIGQCCNALLPPKLDSQLLRSQALEQLLFLSSWFLLRRLRCTWSMRTNLQLCSQLVE